MSKVKPMSARERSQRYRESKRPPGWVDGRGRHKNHARGERHPRWNNGRMLSSHGYVLVRVNDGHHLQQAHGYAYEHQIVAEQMLGRRLAPGEVVHHRNEDKTDNRSENLEVTTNSEHIKHHAVELNRKRWGAQ